jgi:uncharacterized membrane protein YgcG
MKRLHPLRTVLVMALSTAMLACLGCGPWKELRRQPEPPLGTISDHIWQIQETNAEASDFVIYQHEFKLNQARLNMAGEDHVKQIAERLLAGQDFPVIVERGMTSVRENTKYKLPVHPSPELDMQRREVLVHALVTLGVADAEQRVSVAPALTPGYKATEAAGAYLRGMGGSGGFGGGGFGGGGGGFGGGGIF